MNALNLKKARERTGLNQKQFAESLQMSQQRYQQYESGKREPDNETLIALAKALSVTANYLLDIPEAGDAAQIAIRIPVLGSIPAGIPIEAIEDVLDYEDVPANWAIGGLEYFALKIKGDSMAPKYLENDVVIFLKSDDCENGSECAVMVNSDEATFKKVIKQNDGIVLQPLNTEEYEPVFYSNDDIENLPVRVIGIAEEIRRKSRKVRK